MFEVRLSTTFNSSDPIEDLQLPCVPNVGDVITVSYDSAGDVHYLVKAREFFIDIQNGVQGDAVRVLLHVDDDPPMRIS